MEALLVEILFRSDVFVERRRDVLVNQHADAVQALEGDVRHLIGDSLAQHALGGVFIGFIRRAHGHLDVRAHLGEFLGDLLVRFREQFGERILDHDFGLGLRLSAGNAGQQCEGREGRSHQHGSLLSGLGSEARQTT